VIEKSEKNAHGTPPMSIGIAAGAVKPVCISEGVFAK